MSHLTSLIWLAEAFGLAFTLTLLVTPLVIRRAAALKLYDSPDEDRRLHEQPVPRLGGVAVFLCAAAIVCVLFSRTQPAFILSGPAGDAKIRFLAGAFIGAALLFLVGLIDDIRSLSPGLKFVAEVIAAGIACYFGAHLKSVALGYGPGIEIGILEYPILILWIVGVTNVFNFIDGLNGLAGGIAIVACATILVACAALGNFSLILPTVALAGALLGFLRYNFPKAKIFLGDSGSLSIGFLLAVFSVQASVNSYGATLVIIPMVALSVPLMDGTLAILRRWLRNVPISGADARHIHHRLLALGLSAQNTAVLLWTLAASFAGFGLLITLTAPFVATSFAILGMVGVAVMVIYGTNLLSYTELIVAGEVLASAPSRVRRVISDQILATDFTAHLAQAETIEAVSELLVEAAPGFGFLGMMLSSEGAEGAHLSTQIHPVNWAWKLDYPIRVGGDHHKHQYVLSIWCSPETSTRPYGAERVARVIGPALRNWFEERHLGATDETKVPPRKRFLLKGRRAPLGKS